MPKLSWAIVETQGSWRVGRSDGVSVQGCDVAIDDSANAARAIASTLRIQGYRTGDELVLCLSSERCLVAQLEAGSANETYQAKCFRLEEAIPVSAEHFVADFIRSPSGLLGLAVDATELVPLVQSLETEGLLIRTVTSTVLLATQVTLRQTPDLPARCVLVWPQAGSFDVLSVRDQQVCDWLSVRGDQSALDQNVWMLTSQDSQDEDAPTVYCCGGLTDGEHDEAAADSGHVSLPTRGLFEQAVLGAASVLRGEWNACVDFRRDKLAGRSVSFALQRELRWFGVSACVLLIAVIAALELRSAQYEAIAEQHQAAMAEIFEQVFPGQEAPPGIRSRLESERSKTAGLRDTKRIPEVASAIDPLRELLASLPESVRFTLSEISVQGRQLKLDATVRTHGDATTVADALAQAGFELDAPKTTQVAEGTVAVSFTAEYRPKAKAKSDAPKPKEVGS